MILFILIAAKVQWNDYLLIESSCHKYARRQMPHSPISRRILALMSNPPNHACHFLPSQLQVSSVICLPQLTLVVLLAVEYPEDGKEQVDNVQVKRDSRSNLLLNMVVAHDKLSVHQNISAEDERCHGSVDELGSAIVGKESCHKSKKDEYP